MRINQKNVAVQAARQKSQFQPSKLTETSGEPRDPQVTPDGDTVVFASGVSDPLTRELYTVGMDGENQKQLTNRVVNLSWQPAISPDGEKIAYVVEKEGKTDLQVMNLDGTGNVNLTDTNKGYWNPSWSPDGKTIVTTSRDTIFGNLELVTVAADGSSKTQLTNLGYNTENPVFSPTGEHVVFGLGPGLGSAVLCSIRATGEGVRTYANDLMLSDKPAVSKDGTVVFSATKGDGRFGLYSVKLESDEPAKQLVDSQYAFSPCFSPDGSKVVFSGAQEGFDFQIYQMNKDGSELKQVTQGESFNSTPVYTQDGKSVVYVSDKDGKYEVYKTDLTS